MSIYGPVAMVQWVCKEVMLTALGTTLKNRKTEKQKNRKTEERKNTAALTSNANGIMGGPGFS